MNANVHFHSLVLDGVFTPPTASAAPVFQALPPPTDDEIAEVLEQVHARVQRLLRRRGRLPEEPGQADPVAEQLPLLAGYAAASIQGLVAGGPRSGHPVRRLRSAAAVVDTHKPRFARLEGFSLHANVALPAHARAGREHLCRYLLRPPLALERLTESSHGQLLYELAHPRADGTTHLLLDPLELLEKLAVLVPAPRTHLLRYHGVLAPHAAWRSLVVPRPVEAGGAEASAGVADAPARGLSPSAAGPARPDWAALLKRVFAVDVLHCPRCGGHRRIVAVHTRPETLRPLLARPGLAVPAAAPRASRSPPALAG